MVRKSDCASRFGMLSAVEQEAASDAAKIESFMVPGCVRYARCTR